MASFSRGIEIDIISMKNNTATIFVIVFVSMMILIFLMRSILFPNFNTQFSSSFSMDAYNSIDVGDSKDDVISKLGDPLQITIDEEHYHLHYAERASPTKHSYIIGSSIKRAHNITKDPSKPIEVEINSKDVSVDEPFRGLSKNEIISKFGQPLTEEHCTTVSIYRYSRCRDPEHNYRVIYILFDDTGHVQEVSNTVIWD